MSTNDVFGATDGPLFGTAPVVQGPSEFTWEGPARDESATTGIRLISPPDQTESVEALQVVFLKIAGALQQMYPELKNRRSDVGHHAHSLDAGDRFLYDRAEKIMAGMLAQAESLKQDVKRSSSGTEEFNVINERFNARHEGNSLRAGVITAVIFVMLLIGLGVWIAT